MRALSDDVVAYRIEPNTSDGKMRFDLDETEIQLAAFLADPQWVHFSMPANLPGSGDACNSLERALYAPNTPANDFFQMRAIATQGDPWVLVSIPVDDKQAGLDCFERHDLEAFPAKPSTGLRMDRKARSPIVASGDRSSVVAGEVQMPVADGQFYILAPKKDVVPTGRSLRELSSHGAEALARRAKAARQARRESLDDFMQKHNMAPTGSIKLADLGRGHAVNVSQGDQLKVCNTVLDWLEKASHDPRPEKPAGSAWHKLLEALHGSHLYGFDNDIGAEVKTLYAAEHKTRIFLVEHNWAQAFEKAEEFSGSNDFVLPFDLCCFEMRMNGRRQCILMCAHDPQQFHVFIQIDEKSWFALGCGHWHASEASAMRRLCYHQIRAICIALEAEVAVAELEKAPAKLNAQRVKKGKTPLKDFHVIRLASRHRREARVPGPPTGRRQRMHFRRGHWRHYDMTDAICEHHWGRNDGPDKRSHCAHCAGWRIRIPWHMAGDPDLGFIDKHYKL